MSRRGDPGWSRCKRDRPRRTGKPVELVLVGTNAQPPRLAGRGFALPTLDQAARGDALAAGQQPRAGDVFTNGQHAGPLQAVLVFFAYPAGLLILIQHLKAMHADGKTIARQELLVGEG